MILDSNIETIGGLVMSKKIIALVLLTLMLLCAFSGCGKEEFNPPTATWGSAFRTLLHRSSDGLYQGDVASLQAQNTLAAEAISAMTSIETGSAVDVFLRNILQIPDLLASHEVDSFFDLPVEEQTAILDAWYIIGNANAASTEKEYIDILDSYADFWLDVWIEGNPDQALPIADPILRN